MIIFYIAGLAFIAAAFINSMTDASASRTKRYY